MSERQPLQQQQQQQQQQQGVMENVTFMPSRSKRWTALLAGLLLLVFLGRPKGMALFGKEVIRGGNAFLQYVIIIEIY